MQLYADALKRIYTYHYQTKLLDFICSNYTLATDY